MNAPFLGFSPQLLAQIAQGAFRPPQPMGVPGMQAPQQAGGMGLGEGMMGLGMGMGGMFGRSGGNPFMAAERTAGDADLAGHGSSPVDPMGGNPNAQPVEVFNPTGAVGGGDGLFGSWWNRTFGGGPR